MKSQLIINRMVLLFIFWGVTLSFAQNIKIGSPEYFKLKEQYYDDCINGKKNGNSADEILHSCGKALSFDTLNFDINKAIADIYFDNNQDVDAVEYYEKCLKIQPNNSEVYKLKTISFGLLANKDNSYYNSAIENINTYLQKNEDDAEVLMMKYNLLEKYDKAEAAKFRIKACQLSPSYCNKSLLFVVDSLMFRTEVMLNNNFSIKTNKTFFDKNKEEIKKIFLSTSYSIKKDTVNKLGYIDKSNTNEIFFLFENNKCRGIRYSNVANDDNTLFQKMYKAFGLEVDEEKHFKFSNKYGYEATIYFDVANETIPYINYYLYMPPIVPPDKNKLEGTWMLTSNLNGITVLIGSTLKFYRLKGSSNEYLAILNQGDGDVKYKAVLNGSTVNFMGNDKIDPTKLGVAFSGIYNILGRFIDVTLMTGKKATFSYLDSED